MEKSFHHKTEMNFSKDHFRTLFTELSLLMLLRAYAMLFFVCYVKSLWNYVLELLLFFSFFFPQTTLQTDEIKNVPCGTRYI